MIGRRHQVALALTALLAVGAACQNEGHGVAAAPLSAPPAAREFTLAASGDVVPHASVVERARFDARGGGYDFRPMFAGAEPALRGADLALCHLETAVTADGTGGTGTGGVLAPPQLADGLAGTGYDGCATASEHTLDDGTDGVRRTLAAMDRVGLRHAGTARTEGEGRSVTMYQAGPARVAHLSYTYGTGANGLPPGEPWAVNVVDAGRMISDARAARLAGADVVVVSVHWGTAWQDAPDGFQTALAERLTASRTNGRPDVDLILGTHTHVPQAYQKVNGTWVVYGLGDQVAGEMYNDRGVQDSRGNDSTLARFTFAPPSRPGTRWRVTRAEYVPQMYDLDAGRVVGLNQAIADGAELQGVRDRIRDVVLSRGAAADGLVMGD
ncbi:CapA family protein [Streptomyces sp. J2-1]|uniref:CapA family protein n=1 Tax=Streptomyces corallincola TaxID=2851888 RepID=UPI001C38BA26|nr:CapA family protein [Streptomyces corallincola]MBV2356286.1 CapA family protein [Streptomyces corallincola]